VCPEVLTPILEVAYGFHLLEEVTIEDCSEDEALVEALLGEEQLDFSFFDDDCDLKSPHLLLPSTDLVPPSLPPGGRPPTTTVVASTSLSFTSRSSV
jgi:hypothetical protein